MAEYLRRVECPICAAPTEESARAVSSTPPAESLAPDVHGQFLSGYSTRRVFFTYNRCGRCSGLFCPVYYTQEQLDRLYSRQAENMVDVPLASRFATHRLYAEILARHCRFSGNYLELGPDIGLFAELCAARGRYSRFFLFEPNREVHGALAARLAGRNVMISGDRYAAGTLGTERLDTAVAIHVLDHLIDPARLLGQLFDDLAPGGTLFLVTHNEVSLLARILRRRWPPYTLQHPVLFSPASITRLLRRIGFQVLEVVGTRNHFPLSHLLRAGLTVAGVERFAPRFPLSWSVSLRLGNIATVAKRP